MNIFAHKMLKAATKSVYFELGFTNKRSSCLDLSTKIERSVEFTPSKLKLRLYKNMLNTVGHSIPPFFPYILLTPWHFDMVTDSLFPLKPLGILHKKEELDLLRPLKIGVWRFQCQIFDFQQKENGVEFKIQSDLYIDDIFSWRSTTTAFQKHEDRGRKKHKSLCISNATLLMKKQFDSMDALKYGLLSQNIDPIHMSGFSAKMMGHPSNILHGAFASAFFIQTVFSDSNKKVSVKFIKPIYLPSNIYFYQTSDGFLLTTNDENNLFSKIYIE